MTSARTEDVRLLLADCRASGRQVPTWREVTDDAARLRLGAAYADAAITTGLLGDSIYFADIDRWPTDVTDTLHRLGLFDRYSPTTVHGVLAHLSRRRVTGLVNDVKGIDLELQTMQRINTDTLHLPGVDHAQQAASLTQPGWDLQTFHQDHPVGHLQVKATDDWRLLVDHLARYPQYPDIVTNHEAITAAAQHGMDTSHLIDAGSDAALTEHVTSALQHLSHAHAVHELVPELAIAAILAVAAMKLRAGQNRRETAQWVREQVTTAGLANLAGLAIQLATGTAALRPFAAVATRFTLARGRLATQIAQRAQTRRAHVQALLATRQ
jgi:hypothetical protein